MTDLAVHLHHLRRVDGQPVDVDQAELGEALAGVLAGIAEALDGTGFAIDAATVHDLAPVGGPLAATLPPAEAAAVDQARRRAWHEDPTA